MMFIDGVDPATYQQKHFDVTLAGPVAQLSGIYQYVLQLKRQVILNRRGAVHLLIPPHGYAVSARLSLNPTTRRGLQGE
jgi:hypothetical protein